MYFEIILLDGGTFPLSDASALLMRLELHGVDVKERARELTPLWEKHNDNFVSLFYEGHACFNNLLAGDTAANTVLIDNMREYINDNRKVRQRFMYCLSFKSYGFLWFFHLFLV